MGKTFNNCAQENTVSVYMTSLIQPGNPEWYQKKFPMENRLDRKEDCSLQRACEDVSGEEGQIVIHVNPGKNYQSILGFGTSVDESTVCNLMKMSPVVREDILRKLIDPQNGAGMTLFRLCIGSSDFTAREFYTYYDNVPEGEPDWNNETGTGFSIQKDHEYHIVEIVQQIMKIAREMGIEKEIRFFSSPWTPPGWMKLPTPESASYEKNEAGLKGGMLNSDYLEELTVYYVRYLEEYAKLGIPVYAMTLQNEPYLDIAYPSCLMTSQQQAVLAALLKKRITDSSILRTAGVNPFIWVFDHNFSEGWQFVKAIADREEWKSIDGIAFHSYAGDPEVMREIADAYPEKKVYLTERAVWGSEGAAEIITWLRNRAGSYNTWVSMLDSNRNTHQWTGEPGPSMFIQNAEKADDYWILPEFYLMGQFSRYIRPGYVRVDSDTECGNIWNVVCKSPVSNEIVMVAVNKNKDSKAIRVICKGQKFETRIPAETIATYRWNG